MLTPEQLKQLADLGWAALFLGTVLVIAIGLHRQWWVPGWLYKAERERRIKAESANAKLLPALERALTRGGRGSERALRDAATRSEQRLSGDEGG